MALWAVDKTMEEEKLRKKGGGFSFSIFLYLFSRVLSGGPTKEGIMCQTRGLAEHYGGFEGKERQNKSCWKKGWPFSFSFNFFQNLPFWGMFPKEVQSRMRVVHVN